MKASVQYNDFIGTSAADISDNSKLNDFLSMRGVDNLRFDAIGARFNCNYSDLFSVYIICIDKDQSTVTKKHLVEISFEKNIEMAEFFDLFKRFDVIVLKKNCGYQDSIINESITIDDRENNEK